MIVALVSELLTARLGCIDNDFGYWQEEKRRVETALSGLRGRNNVEQVPFKA